jgi:hypothetical protein
MLAKSLFISIYPVIALGLFALPLLGQEPPVWLLVLSLIAFTVSIIFGEFIFIPHGAHQSKFNFFIRYSGAGFISFLAGRDAL